MSRIELEQLLVESNDLTETQPEEFKEILQYVRENDVDPSIREFVEIVTSFSEPVFHVSTHI